MEHFGDIAVFVRVVEAGSFTAAAEKLGLSQSAVSKCVTRLEERLGARLLNRSTRKLSLTEAGTALHERGQRAIQELEEAELEVERLQSEPRGILRINAPMSFAQLHLAPLVPEFLDRYPALALDLQLDDRTIDLVEEGFDCAIRVKALSDSALVAKRLAPCRQVLCASPDYLRRRGTPHSPRELAEHACLIYTTRDAPFEWRLRDATGQNMTVVVSGPLYSNNGLIMREAALQGLGIFHAPTFYVGDLLRAERLRAILTDCVLLPELNIYAVYPQRRNLAPKARAFIDFLSERFGPEPDWDGT